MAGPAPLSESEPQTHAAKNQLFQIGLVPFLPASTLAATVYVVTMNWRWPATSPHGTGEASDVSSSEESAFA